jgi:hypothetical protein
MSLASIYLPCIMQNDCWRLGSIFHNGWSYIYSMVSVGLFKIILCLGIACSFPSVCRYCVYLKGNFKLWGTFPLARQLLSSSPIFKFNNITSPQEYELLSERSLWGWSTPVFDCGVVACCQ